MSDIITTLHPENDESVNLYPNIKKENIPSESIDRTKLDAAINSLLNSINELHPSGVDTAAHILAFTYNKGIYIGSDTGNWYYWNGTAYVSGGTYQAAQIADDSVTFDMINKSILNKYYFTNTITSGTQYGSIYIRKFPNSSGNKIRFLVGASSYYTSFTVYGYIGSSATNLTGGYVGTQKEFTLNNTYDYFRITFNGTPTEDVNVNCIFVNLSILGNLTSELFNIKTNSDKIPSIEEDLTKIPDYIFETTFTDLVFLYPRVYVRNMRLNTGDKICINAVSDISVVPIVYGYIGSTPYLIGYVRTYFSYYTLTRDYDHLEIVYQLQTPLTQATKATVICVNLSLDNLVSRIFNISPDLTLSYSPNVLVIGDSYSQMGTYLTKLSNLVTINRIVNLGVGSATLKDKYADRETYPYTDNPTQNDNTGNHNTFACQIEKLKANFETYYPTSDTYPNLIIIQGGNNDGADSNTDSYINEIYENKNNVYYSIYGNTQQGNIVTPVDYQNTNRTNFCGAMKYLRGELLSLFPNAFIVFITNSRLGYASSIQYSYKNKSEQIKYASSLISTPIVDWSSEGSISFSDYEISGDGTNENPYNITASSEYTTDGMHPNDKGAELLARALANKIVGFGITKFK